MMTIRPPTQPEYTGSADGVFEFYSVGDRFEYGQGQRPHLMGILVIMFMVYKIRPWLLLLYPFQFHVQWIIAPFRTISEGVASWKNVESH